MTIVWDPARPIQVSPHLVHRWRQRISKSAETEEVTSTVVDYLRGQPAGAGHVRPGASGEPAIYFRWRPRDRSQGPGWQIKVVPALGDGWMAATVVRVHGTTGNAAERRRVDRRAWEIWLGWCAANKESPVDLEALRRCAADHDGTITQATRRLGKAVRRRIADIHGTTYEATYEDVPVIEVSSATGKAVRW